MILIWQIAIVTSMARMWKWFSKYTYISFTFMHTYIPLVSCSVSSYERPYIVTLASVNYTVVIVYHTRSCNWQSHEVENHFISHNSMKHGIHRILRAVCVYVYIASVQSHSVKWNSNIKYINVWKYFTSKQKQNYYKYSFDNF